MKEDKCRKGTYIRMSTQVTSQTQDFAERLIANEAASGTPSENGVPVAIRVCEKLRRPLTTLAGAAGFHSLLLRALTLAKREDPGLGALQVNADGSLEDGGLNGNTHEAEGGILLVAHLIGLLFSFIGETLTLRLMQDVWPAASFASQESIGNTRTLTAEGTNKHEPQG
jgi:hypothetical protein